MKLVQDAIAVATQVNLEIGVITNVAHSIQLHLLTAMVQAASVADSPADAQGALQYAQIVMGLQSPSPLRLLASTVNPALLNYGERPVEFILCGDWYCFVCLAPLGQDKKESILRHGK